MPRSISAFASLVCICWFLAGCSSGKSAPKAYPVTGEVTYQGKPVQDADVTFSPATETPESRAASDKTDADGKYSLKTYYDPQHQLSGALPGEYKITVTKKEAGADQAKLMELMKAGKPVPIPKDLLPAKYAVPMTSGLNRTVAADNNNQFKIDLTD